MNNAAEMMENIHMIYSHVQKGNIQLTLFILRSQKDQICHQKIISTKKLKL